MGAREKMRRQFRSRSRSGQAAIPSCKRVSPSLATRGYTLSTLREGH